MEGQDASVLRASEIGLIKGRLASSAGLAYLSEPKKGVLGVQRLQSETPTTPMEHVESLIYDQFKDTNT